MAWISDRRLVSAVSNAGGFGVLAAAAMPPDELRREIAATRALTDRPFGVNLVTLHPLFDAALEVCVELEVGHVVLAGGLPPATAIERLKRGAVRVLCFAPALPIAKRLLRGGVDALIVEGNEAGGHVGPTATSVLAQEILPHVGEAPVFVAGGIGRGEAIAAYLEMGAAGCQLGTRFACATESPAHPRFKEAFIRATARDAIVSPQIDSRFRTIPVRALANPAMSAFVTAQREVARQLERGAIDHGEAQRRVEHFWAGRLRRAVVHGDVENGSLMAGQSVGLVSREQSAREIIAELVDQAALTLADRAAEGAS